MRPIEVESGGYYVVDCGFNRKWYADMIGKRYDRPPGYAAVTRATDWPRTNR
jgi:hypothetical protein